MNSLLSSSLGFVFVAPLCSSSLRAGVLSVMNSLPASLPVSSPSPKVLFSPRGFQEMSQVWLGNRHQGSHDMNVGRVQRDRRVVISMHGPSRGAI
jgi:hypothetical protein